MEMDASGTNCTKSQAAPCMAGLEHRKPAAIAAAVETQAMKSRPLRLAQGLAPMNKVGQISLEMAVTGTNCTKSQAAPSMGISLERRKPAAIAAAVETQAHLLPMQTIAPMNQVG